MTTEEADAKIKMRKDQFKEIDVVGDQEVRR